MERASAPKEYQHCIAKEVLTPEDLAELPGISVWTIYSRTSKRKRSLSDVDLPPFFRIGKLVRFYRKDLVLWLESQTKLG